MDKTKVTITDVARRAGVSKGTVDRVLHNRGEVSQESIEKVNRAVAELEFKPNIYASMLAARKACEIAVLLPHFRDGEYWSRIFEGYQKGSSETAPLNVQLKVYTFDQDDVDSFCEATSRVLETRPSGVAFSPIFKNESATFAENLHKLGIPYVYVDTKLEDEHYFAYFGMPMYRSGWLCAALLTERLNPADVHDALLLRIRRDRSRESDPTVSRREGFKDYIHRYCPDCKVHSVFLDPSSQTSMNRSLSKFFQEHPDVKLIVMLNSRIHITDFYFRANPSEGRRIIGFDNLEANLKMLEDGIVDALVTQHIVDQARLAVECLSNYLIMQQEPAVRDNYMHMDILTRYNIENY